MDISKWPIDRVMALPDWCFGRQWWIGEEVETLSAGIKYFFFSDMPPDVFVLWDIFFSPGLWAAGELVDLTLVLCHQTPDAGNIQTLTRLLRQFSTPNAFYDMHLQCKTAVHLGPMKVLIEANNDGIGGRMRIIAETVTALNNIAVLVSALPKEVPDWVVSGLAGVR